MEPTPTHNLLTELSPGVDSAASKTPRRGATGDEDLFGHVDTAGPSGAGLSCRSPNPMAALLQSMKTKVGESLRRMDNNDKSLFLFPTDHPARQFCIRLVQTKWFKSSVLFMVIANVILLGCADPTCVGECLETSMRAKVLDGFDLFFTIGFTIDLVCQVVACNFMLGPGAYLKNGWSWIDFLTTTSGYLTYLPLGGGGGGLSGIRAMRALRPLRALNAIPGLRRLVQTLLQSLPLLMDVILLLGWIFCVFGIVALQLFMGELHGRCMVPASAADNTTAPTDSNITYSGLEGFNSTAASTNSSQRLLLVQSRLPHQGDDVPDQPSTSADSTSWVFLEGYEDTPCALHAAGLMKCPEGSSCIRTSLNPNHGYTSFDNFGATALNIFQMLTLDAWGDTLLHPLEGAMGPALPTAFFIALVLLGSYFAMQLLIAILSSKFAQLEAQDPQKRHRRRRRRPADPDATEDKHGNPIHMSPWERTKLRLANWWHDFHKAYLRPTKRRQLPWWRQKVWDVVHTMWFNNVATMLVMINTLTMAMEFAHQPEVYTMILEKINLALTACFILEFTLKHVGVGFVRYWQQMWNVMDGIIVLLSIVELLMSAMMAAGGMEGMQALRTFRLLRILRSLRLLARIDGLRRLMKLIIQGMVALKDFFLLLGIFIYIFAVLGMQQFGGASTFGCEETPLCRSNFNNLWEALYTTMQVLTASDWVAVSWNAMRAKGTAAILYFIVWVVIGNFILLTLFLAILITNFQNEPESTEEEVEEDMNPYASETMSEATMSCAASSAASSYGGNQLAVRVLERRDNKLDTETVAKMKTWLMLMGFDLGLTMQEVEVLKEKLDGAYQSDPNKFAQDRDFLQEERAATITGQLLYTKSMRRASTLSRPSKMTLKTLQGNSAQHKVQRSSNSTNGHERSSGPVGGASNQRLMAWIHGQQNDDQGGGIPDRPSRLSHQHEQQRSVGESNGITHLLRKIMEGPHHRPRRSSFSGSSLQRPLLHPQELRALKQQDIRLTAGSLQRRLLHSHNSSSFSSLGSSAGSRSPLLHLNNHSSGGHGWASPSASLGGSLGGAGSASYSRGQWPHSPIYAANASLPSKLGRDPSGTPESRSRGGAWCMGGQVPAASEDLGGLQGVHGGDHEPPRQAVRPRRLLQKAHSLSAYDSVTLENLQAVLALTASPQAPQQSLPGPPSGSVASIPRSEDAADMAHSGQLSSQHTVSTISSALITHNSWDYVRGSVNPQVTIEACSQEHCVSAGHTPSLGLDRSSSAMGYELLGDGFDGRPSTIGRSFASLLFRERISNSGAGGESERNIPSFNDFSMLGPLALPDLSSDASASISGSRQQLVTPQDASAQAAPDHQLSGPGPVAESRDWLGDRVGWARHPGHATDGGLPSRSALSSIVSRLHSAAEPGPSSRHEGSLGGVVIGLAQAVRRRCAAAASRAVGSLGPSVPRVRGIGGGGPVAEGLQPSPSAMEALLDGQADGDAHSVGHGDDHLPEATSAGSQPGVRERRARFAVEEEEVVVEKEEGEAAKSKETCRVSDGGEAPEGEAVDEYLQYSSMFVLSPTNRFRLACNRVIKDSRFDNFILLLIFVSSIMMAIDSPKLDKESTLVHNLKLADTVLTSLFALEMAFKLCAKGLVLHREAYFRTAWDCLDGVIVITSVTSLLVDNDNLVVFRTMRLFRTLRPLRVLHRWRGMQLVVEAIIASLPAVSNVVLFGGFEFGIFGILGVQLFSGRFNRCNQSVIDGVPVEWKDQCIPGTFICGPNDLCTPGEETERWWSRPFRHFDNIGNALLSLFTVATLDGYMGLAQMCIDAVGLDQQPKPKNAPWMGIYIIAFVLFGSWFWVNLLVTVVVDHYSKLVAENDELLTTRQAKEFIKLFKFSASKGDYWKSIPVPQNTIRAWSHKVASHPSFDVFIMSIIIANMVVMALEHDNAAPVFLNAMVILNFVFTAVFVMELVIKVLATGPKVYIQDHWNKLDFFIILVSIPDLMSQVVPALAGFGFMTVFKVFRIARMFKLINKAKGLRTMFNTLIASLPAIFNVGSLLFLLMFVYAVLGMNIFGSTSRFDNSGGVKFDDFGSSLMALFRAFTSDGWTDIMATASACNDHGYQCPPDVMAAITGVFFVSFVILGNLVMLNLVVAVIIDNFIDSAQSEGLLKTNSFIELMKLVVTMKVFVRIMRIRIQSMQQQDKEKEKDKKPLSSIQLRKLPVLASLEGRSRHSNSLTKSGSDLQEGGEATAYELLDINASWRRSNVLSSQLSMDRVREIRSSVDHTIARQAKKLD